MKTFWNDDLLDTTLGLDILGVRGIDQAIEIGMVNGITTISQRIRYLSILTWALGEFLTSHADQVFEREVAEKFLRRVEFLVLVATQLDRELNGTEATGTLGSTVFNDEIIALRDDGVVDVPDDRGGAMLGTYIGPCRSTGLIHDVPAPQFFQITPRGRKIWESRKESLASEALLRLMTDGGVLTNELAEQAIPDFSVSALASRPEEATLLKSAMLEPWPAEGSARIDVEQAYANLQGTVAWAKGYLSSRSSSAAEVIARNYNECCEAGGGSEVALKWTEYEYRRRCHLALELLMSGLTGGLKRFEEAAITDVIADWEASKDTTDYLTGLWPGILESWGNLSRQSLETIPQDLFLSEGMPSREIRQLPPKDQALLGMAILQATAIQTTELRHAGLVNTDTMFPGDRAIDLLEASGDQTLRETLLQLLRLAAMAHLQTTLRKMGAGQKCSLRFFPEGPILRPTGLDVFPGHSGDRLTNVCRFLTDLGELRNGPDGLKPAEVSG